MWYLNGKIQQLPIKSEEKPNVNESMLLSFIYVNNLSPLKEGIKLQDGNKENVDTFILKISNIDIVETDKDYTLSILINNKEVLLRNKGLIELACLTVTDDPKIEWASDWSDLGSFRLIYKMIHPKVKVLKNKLIFIVKKVKNFPLFETHMTLPDKKRWF